MTRMKRLLATVLAACTFLLVGATAKKLDVVQETAVAAEVDTITAVETWDISKTAGIDNVTAMLYKHETYTDEAPYYVLEITGSGEMIDWTKASAVVWGSGTDYRKKIVSVTIGDNITNIGGYAFNQFTQLTSVIIPRSVIEIGTNAFYACAFTEVEIPETVELIKGDAFNGSSSHKLQKVTILGKETKLNAKTSVFSGATIYAYKGSLAEEWAATNRVRFLALDALISKVGVTLGADLSVKYYVSLTEEEFATATMKFRVATYGVNDVQGVATTEENVYLFTFEGVAPQWMGENITATLYVNGEEKETKNYSVLTYCKAILSSNATDLGVTEEKFAALKTLTVDMLNYGAAAQTFLGYDTEHLVNDGVEGGSTYTALKESVSGTAGSLSGVAMKGVNLHFETANKLYFYFTATNVSNLNAVIYKNGLPIKVISNADFETETVDGVAMYYVATDAIKATELGDLFTVTVYQGADVLNGASIVYSVKSYVCAKQDDATGLGALVQALWLYGESAKAYQAA